MKKNKYYSIQEVANYLGLSRIAIYQRVKKGQIKAIRIGKNYAIPQNYINNFINAPLDDEEKKEIDKSVKRTVSEYGEVLRLLGKE
ncbi:MAG: helix-turn-helix domain-containing protein [bacterium]|nr:helix-turn-helix domain-containing protein [bacterium]